MLSVQVLRWSHEKNSSGIPITTYCGSQSYRDHLLSDMIEQMTYRLGLTGWPLEHSLSPTLQTTFINAAGVAGSYHLYPVPPQDDTNDQLKTLLTQLRDYQLQGLNVTIPHKQTIIPLLDDLTTSASAIGAVNTIYMQGGLLTGDNTDSPGFMLDLDRLLQRAPNLIRKGPPTALVLGAGGSARAVSYALSRAYWQVTIAARCFEQAQSLTTDLFQPGLSPLSLVTLNTGELADLTPDLIINTTPIGMSPNIDASPWPDKVPFPVSATIYDLVYNPLETKLVKNARESGLIATSGLGMLIEQAALAFYRWTGMQVSEDTKQEAEVLASVNLRNE
jgi:shikimate dehydrogenase